MENSHLRTSVISRHLGSSSVKDGKQNLIKKRPSTTKLDLEKIFQESIQLTQVFKKLSSENNQLRLQYQKVQQAKSSRQALISTVEQIVKDKAKELNKNPTNQSSWLVHKLNSKVYELKNKIEAKEKAFREVEMSKQSEWIRQKQSDLKCLDEVIEHLKKGKTNKPKLDLHKFNEVKDYDEFQQSSNTDNQIMNGIKEVVWLQEEIQEKEDEILEAEKIYEEDQRQVRKIMMQISKKKVQLAEIKELQGDYYRAQEEFKEEKKKKQQRLAGNKNYLDELIQSRHNEVKKLQQLKEKYSIIEAEETKSINQLEAKLQKMKNQYEEKNKTRQGLQSQSEQDSVASCKQKWVKRVAFKEIKNIAKNLNYFIALKRVPKDIIFKTIFKNEEQQLSIRQVITILQHYPFDIESYHERELLARYCIENAGQGYFLEDMDTSEAVPIIRSVLSKLIGDVRIYSEEQEPHLIQKTGELMHKFHSLVQQNVETKQGNSKKITKETMEEAIISTELDLDADQINFIILYLFSWTHNIDQLEITLLTDMPEKGVRWINKTDTEKRERNILDDKFL